MKEVEAVSNPYMNVPKYESRFKSVLTKLYVFSLVEYTKVVFIDADALVLDNPDDMFECGKFCAAFINPCAFNSGVMVLEPSMDVFNDMISKLSSLTSYDGGDQGFLNQYYPNLLEAPLWKSGVPNAEAQFQRIPFGYHLDHTHYYVNFKWNIACPPLKIVEFLSLPLLKPWQWWAYFMFTDISLQWHEHRSNLSFDPMLEPSFNVLVILAAIPLVILLLLLRYSRSVVRRVWPLLPTILLQPVWFFAVCSLINGVFGCIAIGAAVWVVPAVAYPIHAMGIFTLWATLFYWCFMGLWFTFCCKMGYQKMQLRADLYGHAVTSRPRGSSPMKEAILAFISFCVCVGMAMWILYQPQMFTMIGQKITFASLSIVFVLFYSTYFCLRLSAGFEAHGSWLAGSGAHK